MGRGISRDVIRLLEALKDGVLVLVDEAVNIVVDVKSCLIVNLSDSFRK